MSRIHIAAFDQICYQFLHNGMTRPALETSSRVLFYGVTSISDSVAKRFVSDYGQKSEMSTLRASAANR